VRLPSRTLFPVADTVRKRLAEVLPLVWETIPDSFFEKLWKAMPSRVAAVIEAKGWYTKYKNYVFLIFNI